jgi:hypothetical protein
MELATSEQPVDEERFARTLRRLASPLPSWRRQAKAELASMGPDASRRLLSEHRFLTRQGSKYGLMAGMFIQLTNVLHQLMQHYPAARFYLSILYYLSFVVACVVGLYSSFLVSWLSEVRHAIAAFDDPRAIGPVAEFLKKRRIRKNNLWRARLLHLLSLVETADAEALRQVDCASLNSILETEVYRDIFFRPRDFELITAILKAYPYIGNEEALGKATFMARHNSKEIQTAARDCLPALKARVTAERERRKQAQVGADLLRASDNTAISSQTLLRASDNTAISSQTLLRAASATAANAQDQAPLQLLRAAEREA